MPNTVLLIASDNKIGVPRVQIEDTIKSVLRDKGIQLIFASDYRKGGNILCKICKLAQQVQFGILIYDNKVQKRTIPNLFYESSLMHYLGKELIMIGYKTRRPSDLESVEWIKYDEKEFKPAFEQRVKNIFAMQAYFESVADNEIATGNYLVGIEYLKKLLLMGPTIPIADKMAEVNAKIKKIEAREFSNNIHFVTMTRKGLNH